MLLLKSLFHPVLSPEELFDKLITTAKDTEWGKKYDYKSIVSLKEFKERVPVSDYDNLKTYIDKL